MMEVKKMKVLGREDEEGQWCPNLYRSVSTVLCKEQLSIGESSCDYKTLPLAFDDKFLLKTISNANSVFYFHNRIDYTIYLVLMIFLFLFLLFL